MRTYWDTMKERLDAKTDTDRQQDAEDIKEAAEKTTRLRRVASRKALQKRWGKAA